MEITQSLLSELKRKIDAEGPRPQQPAQAVQDVYDFARFSKAFGYDRDSPEEVTWTKSIAVTGTAGGFNVELDPLNPQTPSPAGWTGPFVMTNDPKIDGGAIGAETILSLIGISCYLDLSQFLVANRTQARRIYDNAIFFLKAGNDRSILRRGWEGPMVYGGDVPADAAAAVNATLQQVQEPYGRRLRITPRVVGKSSNLELKINLNTEAAVFPGSTNHNIVVALHILQTRKR